MITSTSTPPSVEQCTNSQRISPRKVYEMLSRQLGGGDVALAFMRSFSGLRIDMPSITEVERLSIEDRIVNRAKANPSSESMGQCANFYGVSRTQAARTVLSVGKARLNQLRHPSNSAWSDHPLLRFVETCVRSDKDCFVSSIEIVAAHREFCNREKLTPMSKMMLGKFLLDAGISLNTNPLTAAGHRFRLYGGIRLTDDGKELAGANLKETRQLLPLDPADFFRDCVFRSEELSVTFDELLTAWAGYCTARNGIGDISRTGFGRIIRRVVPNVRRCLTTRQRHCVVIYRGIGLNRRGRQLGDAHSSHVQLEATPR